MIQQFKTPLLIVLMVCLLIAPGLIGAQSPKRGNYVPADLNIKIHPFIEAHRYGGRYSRGELIQETESGWELSVNLKQDRGGARTVEIPDTNINLPENVLEPGLNVIVKQSDRSNSEQFLVTDYDRYQRYLFLVLACLLVCLAVGGIRTLRSLFGVFAGIIYLFTVALPLIQSGYNVLIQISIFFSIVTVFVLPGSLGFNRKSLSAIFSAITSGLLALGLLYSLAQIMMVIGLRNESLQVVEYATRYFPEQVSSLSIQNIVIGGILIGCLGVILDVTVDVTSSAAEIDRARPDLSLGEHLNRSLTVNSQLLGTMTNTLLLAYIGTDLFLILTVYLLPTPGWILLNKDFIAVEVLRGAGGALGFLSAAPLSIFFYRIFGQNNSNDTPEPPDPPQ